MENEHHETFNLQEAADFLKLHWQTLRTKAKRGEVPAAKLGRRWVFLKSDLVTFLRANYSTPRPRSQVQQSVGDTLCCTNDPIRVSGGAALPHRMELEYKSLLKQ